MPADTAITNKKLYAYEKIKEMLLNGEISSADPIIERQLCQQLGISRTPVREALQSLINDGLLTTIEGKGVFLRQANLRDIAEVSEVRLALESLAVFLFVERATNETIQALRAIFDTAETALAQNDHARFMDCDMEFHLYIAQESKNIRLKEAINSNYTFIRYMAASVREDPEICSLASDNHAAIMEAIERRDKEAAAKCMAEHLRQVKIYHQNRYYLFQ